jgi:hypothetical protein
MDLTALRWQWRVFGDRFPKKSSSPRRTQRNTKKNNGELGNGSTSGFTLRLMVQLEVAN